MRVGVAITNTGVLVAVVTVVTVVIVAMLWLSPCVHIADPCKGGDEKEVFWPKS